MYLSVVPSSINKVGFVTKRLIEFLAMGENIDSAKLECRHDPDVTIDNKRGAYYGEWLTKRNLPHGRGVHICGNDIFLRYFDKGHLGEGTTIHINKRTKLFRIYFSERTRPGGKMLFDHDTTDRIKSEGFMGIGKDLPEDVDCHYRD